MANKQLMIVTVKRDQHGNPPTERELRRVTQKMRRAVREAGYTHAVVVVPDTVVVQTIGN